MSARIRRFESGSTVERFNDRAEDYAKYRPSYPLAAIDAILEGLGDPGALCVVDVGAGTGISSRLLTARGANVIAVEPNAEMRAAALAGGTEARDGTAQALPLASGSADAVTCFQAFHWFAVPATLVEFARVLRSRGRLAIVWNERDDEDDFTRAYGELVDNPVFAGGRTNLAGYATAQDMFSQLVPGTGFGDVRTRVFSNRQRLDRDGLLGRVRSTSYAPREGGEAARLYSALETLVDRFQDSDGFVELVYRTEVHLLDKGS